MRRRRKETTRERGLRDARDHPELECPVGERQTDSGEADFRVRGAVTRGKYLTVSFPHSNVGIEQVFWGETPECVCEGLKDVLASIGVVPPAGLLRQRHRGGQALRHGRPHSVLPSCRKVQMKPGGTPCAKVKMRPLQQG